MQLCCPIPAILRRAQLCSYKFGLYRTASHTYASSCAVAKNARSSGDRSPPRSPNLDKLLVLSQTRRTSPPNPKGSLQFESQKSKSWEFKDCAQSINDLVSTMPPQSATDAVKRIALSSSVPIQLRPRILASASHCFLHHGNFAGALAMYKLLVSMRFAPPVSLIAAMYRVARKQDGYKATDLGLKGLPLLSFVSMDIRSLRLLLLALEKSRQPEVMENVVQDYATQVSSSCLVDASIIASMIRGYCAARQLDGCYAWFYRFRNNLSGGDEFVPATPYLSLMTASRKLDPTNTKGLHRIANMMREDGIPFIITAYNEILLSELKNRNFTRVFGMYSALQGSQSANRPDVHTFSLLFDALWKNATGPDYGCPLHPEALLHQMVHMSTLGQISLATFSINSALRYFTYVGDFRSAIFIVDTALSARISPNSLTIRWTLEELLKRCQRAFDPSATLELEKWAKLLLGGLTRDHYALTTHLLDVVRSTRTNNEARRLTQSVQDALQVVHTSLVSNRPLVTFASQKEIQETPVLSRIRDVLNVCADPMHGLR